jgi:hypothetical protein
LEKTQRGEAHEEGAWGGWHVRGRRRRTRGRRVRTCTGIGDLGECIRFGTLIQALPPSIWVIMQAFMFTLNDAYAALRKPMLLGKATVFWDLLGAHAFGRFRPGLLIGRNNVLFG